jgi:hypothetical protein
MRLLCLSLLLCALSANAQMRRRSSQQPGGDLTGGAYNQPAATMHGTLKKITNKDIIIFVEGDQSVTIDRTHKTKFMKDGKEIKPAEIAQGSVLTIDVNHDPQLNPLALTVTVDSGPVDSGPDSSTSDSATSGPETSPPATTGAGAASTSSAPAQAPGKPQGPTNQ